MDLQSHFLIISNENEFLSFLSIKDQIIFKGDTPRSSTSLIPISSIDWRDRHAFLHGTRYFQGYRCGRTRPLGSACGTKGGYKSEAET